MTEKKPCPYGCGEFSRLDVHLRNKHDGKLPGDENKDENTAQEDRSDNPQNAVKKEESTPGGQGSDLKNGKGLLGKLAAVALLLLAIILMLLPWKAEETRTPRNQEKGAGRSRR